MLANLPNVRVVTGATSLANCAYYAERFGLEDWYDGGGRRVCRVDGVFYSYDGWVR